MNQVMTALLVHQLSRSQLNMKQEPLLIGLVWYNVQGDSSFKPLGQITQSFIVAQFVARCMVLWEVHNNTLASQGLVDYSMQVVSLYAIFPFFILFYLGNYLCSTLSFFRVFSPLWVIPPLWFLDRSVVGI